MSLAVGSSVLAVAWRARLAGLSVTRRRPGPRRRRIVGRGGDACSGHRGALRRGGTARSQPGFGRPLPVLRRRARGGHRARRGLPPVRHAGRGVRRRRPGGARRAPRFPARLGLESERLLARECRKLEPLLAPSVRGGLLVDGDHQVDNRRLAAPFWPRAPGRASSVVAASGGGRDRAMLIGSWASSSTAGALVMAAAVVLAAGCWSAGLTGLRAGGGAAGSAGEGPDPPAAGCTRPAVHLPQRARRWWPDRSIYVVPRADGEIVVGATVEEQGFDTTVTAGAVHQLLRDAWQGRCPASAELELVETHAGLRPGSPDNAADHRRGGRGRRAACVATGHYRNGILLTPVTADAVAELLATGTAPELIKPVHAATVRHARNRERRTRPRARRHHRRRRGRPSGRGTGRHGRRGQRRGRAPEPVGRPPPSKPATASRC